MTGRRRFVIALCLLTLVAAVLRLSRLGDWSFTGDEAFTLSFSTVAFSWYDLRPLAFAMNHYLSVPLFGPTEFAIRLFPALFGILAVPALGLLARRSYGDSTALWAAGLVAISPGLVGMSQFGRYYMQSFTLAAMVPLALLTWVTDRRWRWLLLAGGCFVAGWLMVPSSSFVAPGLALWVLLAPRQILGESATAWVRRHRYWLTIPAVALAAGVLWVAMRVRADYMVDGLESGMRYASPTQVALGALGVMGLPVAALAAIGLILLASDRELGAPARWLLPCWAAGAAIAFVGAYPFLAIGAAHVVSVMAVAFLAGGYACARLVRGSSTPAVGYAAIGAFLLPHARDLVSHYADGNHLDFRGAAAVVRELEAKAPGTTYVLGHGNLVPYADGLRVHEFIVSPDSLAWTRDTTRTVPVRLVLSEHRRGLDVPETDSLVQSALHQCRLVSRLTRPRLDYYVNAVRVYDCPPLRQ